MIYIFDMCFTLSYLILKEILKYMHDCNYKVFITIREVALWLEFTFILLFFYAAPAHTISEAGVSFCMCVATKFVFDLVKCTNKRKKINRKWKQRTMSKQ